MGKKDMAYLVLSAVTCTIGLLIGYGLYGNAQHACLGAGIGLAVPLVLLVLNAMTP